MASRIESDVTPRDIDGDDDKDRPHDGQLSLGNNNKTKDTRSLASHGTYGKKDSAIHGISVAPKRIARKAPPTEPDRKFSNLQLSINTNPPSPKSNSSLRLQDGLQHNSFQSTIEQEHNEASRLLLGITLGHQGSHSTSGISLHDELSAVKASDRAVVRSHQHQPPIARPPPGFKYATAGSHTTRASMEIGNRTTVGGFAEASSGNGNSATTGSRTHSTTGKFDDATEHDLDSMKFLSSALCEPEALDRHRELERVVATSNEETERFDPQREPESAVSSNGEAIGTASLLGMAIPTIVSSLKPGVLSSGHRYDLHRQPEKVVSSNEEAFATASLFPTIISSLTTGPESVVSSNQGLLGFSVSPRSENPRSILNERYQKKYNRSFTKKDFVTIRDSRDGDHIPLFTSMFVCPESRECFLSGDLLAGDLGDLVLQRDGMKWYKKKATAEFAAAGRAEDCFRLRCSNGLSERGVPVARFCADPPFRERSRTKKEEEISLFFGLKACDANARNKVESLTRKRYAKQIPVFVTKLLTFAFLNYYVILTLAISSVLRISLLSVPLLLWI